MRIVYYVDIWPYSTGKNDIYLMMEKELSDKPAGAKRYRITAEIPDPKQIDVNIKATSEDANLTILPEQSKPV